MATSRLCIYVTGSYGRGEAVVEASDPEDRSDLDLFFLYDSSDAERKLPRTVWFPVAGSLIRLVHELGFPEFSGDAEWLDVHNVTKMREQLGSPEDDPVNTFTARMLLLLESRPVVNHELYERLLERVVGFYFEDFEEHGAEFRPTFLLNDILRFWRTLTLNYEAGRRKRLIEAGQDKEKVAKAKRKTAVKNFKLGFSRLSTCFSMVVPIAALGPPVSADDVLRLTRLTPTQRWEELRHDGVREMIELYSWFLEMTADSTALDAAFDDESRRADARMRERRFGDLVYRILREIADPETLRFVVV